jgi:hypothetical protein
LLNDEERAKEWQRTIAALARLTKFGEASVVVDYSDAQFVSGCWHGGCGEFGEDCEVDEGAFFLLTRFTGMWI